MKNNLRTLLFLCITLLSHEAFGAKQRPLGADEQEVLALLVDMFDEYMLYECPINRTLAGSSSASSEQNSDCSESELQAHIPYHVESSLNQTENGVPVQSYSEQQQSRDGATGSFTNKNESVQEEEIRIIQEVKQPIQESHCDHICENLTQVLEVKPAERDSDLHVAKEETKEKIKRTVLSLRQFYSRVDCEDGKKVYFCCYEDEDGDPCNLEFPWVQNCIRHIKEVHLKRRKHQCNVCSKFFTRKDDLEKDHVNFHTGERPHKCFSCGDGFKYRSGLRRHLKKCRKV